MSYSWGWGSQVGQTWLQLRPEALCRHIFGYMNTAVKVPGALKDTGHLEALRTVKDGGSQLMDLHLVLKAFPGFTLAYHPYF